jgi:hypothetical protein
MTEWKSVADVEMQIKDIELELSHLALTAHYVLDKHIRSKELQHQLCMLLNNLKVKHFVFCFSNDILNFFRS